MRDSGDVIPNEKALALLRTCRDELLAARRSIATCLEAIERSLEQRGIHQGDEISSHLLENPEHLSAGVATRNAAAGFKVDQTERVLCLGGLSIPLTDSEFAIVAILWTRRPHPVSREELVSQLYKKPMRPKAVDPFVSHLRQKLRLASGGTEYIEAVRGRGWRLKARLGEPLSPPPGVPTSHSDARWDHSQGKALMIGEGPDRRRG